MVDMGAADMQVDVRDTAGNDEECDDSGHDERKQERAQNPTHSALKSGLERSRFPIVNRNHNISILLYLGGKRSQTGVPLAPKAHIGSQTTWSASLMCGLHPSASDKS